MGRSCELVEALEGRVDFCAVQETRWCCRKSRDIGRGFKAVLCGSPRTTSVVGIIVSERFRDSIVSVERFDDRLMKSLSPLRSDSIISSLRTLRRLDAPIKPRMSFGACLMRRQQSYRRVTDAIRQAAESELGITKPGRRKVDKQVWLWTDDVKAKKITVKETEAALKKMRPGKATGPDDVAADLWKSKFWYPTEWLAKFFNQVVAEKKVHECWRQSTTIPI
ncbi:unnamed protein product [Heligmosomoides polygyrus]|uniref:Endo/exonuclease/phosphatase domain-containing protein n=1 Tax=Heligmosomoides polygyrus TaxID=6339 RepID=A0A183GGL4_HELPZ|nr:unnamed protein product [Heligmosomoides polygyrus]